MFETADIAQLAAASGVILSMLTVAKQIYDNTKQAKLANWGVLSERYMSVYSQTSNLELAEIIVKGREDYGALTASEQLAFGHFLENLCIANEGALVMAKNITRTDTAMITLFNRHIRWHLSSNGARQWFEQFQEERGFPEDLTNSIRKAIS
ncbi:MAG TPA: hypothetical protein DCY55_06175 [Gammaproteobacteria bacterium]|nr:hypothetical protein [Gammaproteobacteria bacterium]HAY45855.1 hypothetical protein [Gammaproteobacteria bacterium]